MSRRMKIWSTAGLVLAVAALVLVLIIQPNHADNKIMRGGGNASLAEIAESDPMPVSCRALSREFITVSEEMLPSVVNISTTRIMESSASSLPPLLRDFFGERFNLPRKRKLHGLGSGVIVSEDGYIITNNHVVENAADIQVTLKDFREFEAELVGTDPQTEIAVIRIEGKDLPAAPLGDSGELSVGEWVLAFGNPLYLTSTVTAGIISAKGRSIGIISRESGGNYAIENFIQTDAAINPGNSGGPLVDLNGEVIGINTAIASNTGGYQGYGFAVPINLARRIMNDLIDLGYVVRPWLGISMRQVNEEIAQRFGMKAPRGVLVDRVMEDSPAEEGGLEPLDIILEIDGKEVSQTNEFQQIIALEEPGTEVNITVLRDGEKKELEVELGRRETGNGGKDKDRASYTGIGIKVSNLTSDILRRLRHDAYRNMNGVIVTEVERFSNAAEAGIMPGDLITGIEDEKIESVDEYRSVMGDHQPGEVVIFVLQRVDQTLHAFVRIPED